jgi:precorrin-8X/cobalt-precorrin-8 methylmutase
MPYFLYSGQHVTVDLPGIVADCRRQFPTMELELLPTLENEPGLEDLVVERLTPLAAPEGKLPTDGGAIEARSYQWIDRQLADWGGPDVGARRILRRVIHATADVSFARTLRIHPHAVERGREALAARRPIVCDVRMLQAGMTRVPGEVLCAIDQEEVAVRARQSGCTRAAAAMELLAPQWNGGIVAIGNAPTALWKVLELVRGGAPRPALVIGLPVGFVGAREAKAALAASDLCYITNLGPRGGSPVAAAAVNALATLPAQE